MEIALLDCSSQSMTLLRELLQLLDDPIHIFSQRPGENENLFRFIQTQEQGNLLLEYGFTGTNQVDSQGKHTLSSVIGYPHAVKFCLENGSEVNFRDEKGRTALIKLSRIFGVNSWNGATSNDIITLRNLLISGADTRMVDKCRGCACAPQGCGPGDMLFRTFIWEEDFFPNSLFSIPWLLTIEEYRGIEDAKQTLLVILRQSLFNELGITHICCESFRTKHTNRTLCEHRRYSKILDERMELLKTGSYTELKSTLLQYIARYIVQFCTRRTVCLLFT